MTLLRILCIGIGGSSWARPCWISWSLGDNSWILNDFETLIFGFQDVLDFSGSLLLYSDSNFIPSYYDTFSGITCILQILSDKIEYMHRYFIPTMSIFTVIGLLLMIVFLGFPSQPVGWQTCICSGVLLPFRRLFHWKGQFSDVCKNHTVYNSWNEHLCFLDWTLPTFGICYHECI